MDDLFWNNMTPITNLDFRFGHSCLEGGKFQAILLISGMDQEATYLVHHWSRLFNMPLNWIYEHGASPPLRSGKSG